MIGSLYSGDRHFLTPGDLEFLQVIFDEEIGIRGLKRDCEEAADLAARLLQLFQSGVIQAYALRQMLKPAA